MRSHFNFEYRRRSSQLAALGVVRKKVPYDDTITIMKRTIHLIRDSRLVLYELCLLNDSMLYCGFRHWHVPMCYSGALFIFSFLEGIRTPYVYIFMTTYIELRYYNNANLGRVLNLTSPGYSSFGIDFSYTPG